MYTSHSTVLGLIIDDQLTFKRHSKNKLKECWFTWHQLSKSSNRFYGLNASSQKLLFKTVVLTKLLYAAPIWLKNNIDTFKDFYARVLLKISGATHYASKDLLSTVMNIPPLEIAYEIIAIKFIIKALNSDSLMQGLVLQLEQARYHRFHHEIDMTLKFLSWRTGHGILTRSRIDLLSAVNDGTASYCKKGIILYEDHAWKLHLQQSPGYPSGHVIPLMITDMSQKLLPRWSHRTTDTKVLSLLHGHDLCFNAFKARITGSDNNQCIVCNEADSNTHRIFSCPLGNCSYRTHRWRKIFLSVP